MEHFDGLLVLEAEEAVPQCAIVAKGAEHCLQAEDVVLLQLALHIPLEWPKTCGSGQGTTGASLWKCLG